MRLRNTLLSSTVPVILLIVMTILVGYQTSEQTNKQFDDIITNSVPRVKALFESNIAATRIKGITEGRSIGEGGVVIEGTDAANVKSDLFAYINDLEKSISRYEKHIDTTSASARETLRSLKRFKEEMTLMSLDYFALIDDQADMKLVTERRAQLQEVASDLGRTVNNSVASELNHLRAQGNDVIKASQFGITVGLLSSAFVSAFLFLFSLHIANSITGRVIRLKEAAKEVAQGNFTKRVVVTGKDEMSELGESFNTMTQKLEELDQLKQKNAKELQLHLDELQETKKGMALLLEETQKEKAEDDALLQSIGEGMVATDILGIISIMNPVAKNLFGLEDAAIGKENIFDVPLLNTDNTPVSREQHPVYRAQETKEKTEEVFGYMYHEDKIELRVTANPVIENGIVIGAIMIVRDITKEIHVDRMKTEFISLASHQLRTPLSAIRWFAELLVNGDVGDLDADQLDVAKNIYSSAERMIELVGALLNISRIESGRIIVDPEPTDLKKLVDEVVQDLQAKIEQKKHTLSVSVHPELGLMNVDPRLIRQVYLNLLSNAIKYTAKEGEISVFVSRKGDDVVSQVTDNGYGIPKGQQDHVFERFFRAENVAKVETDGTGLGLYLIKTIVESSEGKIWFESEEGKGTTFWFSLPASGMKAKDGEVSLEL